jgi:hypothetical protein
VTCATSTATDRIFATTAATLRGIAASYAKT